MSPPTSHRSRAWQIAAGAGDQSRGPAKTLPEFIAYAKANPGKINYASVGWGAATNVAGELFNEMAGIKLVNVPYRSSYMPDLFSGQVQAGFTPILQT